MRKGGTYMPTKKRCETRDTGCEEMCHMCTMKECEKGDTDCEEMCHMCTMKRCGTGDTGCKEPAMCHMSSSMCNGVFAPVCAPEVCNVPRIPHHQVLVKGHGILLDTKTQKEICFTIFVERIMQVYKGELELKSEESGIEVQADVLKFFESDGKTHMLAIFHDECKDQDITVTVTIHQEEEEKSTQMFAYSAPMEIEVIDLGGKVVSGSINLYVDHNVHEH